jgi:hypothetical protein
MKAMRVDIFNPGAERPYLYWLTNCPLIPHPADAVPYFHTLSGRCDARLRRSEQLLRTDACLGQQACGASFA